MQFTVPDYYRNFQCLAGRCPDTCCAGWQIVIDQKSRYRYKKLKSPFAKRLRNGVDWKEGSFLQNNKRCGFLNAENLCDIYSNVGKHLLCDTCRKYPRRIEEFEGLREISLSLSCPEAARMILNQRDKVGFIHGEKQGREEEYPEFDFLLFNDLMDSRDYLLEILQDRRVPMNVRLGKSLAYVHDFQRCISKGELYRSQEIREQHRKTGFGPGFFKKWKEYTENVDNSYEIMKQMWKTIQPEMEALREEWPPYVKENLSSLYGKGGRHYHEAVDSFVRNYQQWEVEMEQLMVYWAFTYFCGAVYDQNPFAKMKLAAVSTLFIRDLDAACFIRLKVFTKQDQISICYRYSRELEHSDLNLDRMEEVLTDNKLFSLKSLLKICEDFND